MDIEVYDNEDQSMSLIVIKLFAKYDNRCSTFLYEIDSISLETLFLKDLKMKSEKNEESNGEELFAKGKYCVRKKNKK